MADQPQVLGTLPDEEADHSGPQVLGTIDPADVHAPSAPPAEQPSQYGVGLARAVGQGALFGWGDEAEAAVRSLAPGSPGYNELRHQINKEQEQYEKLYPKTALGANVLGGIGSTVATLGTAPEIGGTAKATSLLAKYAPSAATALEDLNSTRGWRGMAQRGAAYGIPAGALAGAGNAEPGQRVAGAGTGAAQGAAFGGVLGPLAEGIGAGSIGAMRWLTGMKDGAPANYGRAVDYVKKIMARDGLSLEDAAARVRSANDAGVPFTLADVTPGATTAAELMAQRPGAQSTQVLQNRFASRAGTKDRVQNQVNSRLGVTEDPDLYNAGMYTDRAAAAKSNYQRVRDDTTPINDEAINRLLQNPFIGDLFQHAQDLRSMEDSVISATTGKPTSKPLAKIVKETQVPHPDGLVDASGNPMMVTQTVPTGILPDVRTLDYLQRAMDDRASAFWEQGASQAGPALSSARKLLVERLQALSPDFKIAFGQYRGESERIRANELGKSGDFLKMSPGAAADTVSKLSDTGKVALRNGVAANLLSKSQNTSRNINAAGNIIETPRLHDNVRTLFDDPADFDAFHRALSLESQLHQNTQQIVGNSATARRTMAKEDFEQMNPMDMASHVAEALHTGGFSIVRNLLKMMHSNVWNNGMAEQVGHVLTRSDPQEISQILDRAAQNEQVRRNLVQPAGVGALSGGLGVVQRAHNQAAQPQPAAPPQPPSGFAKGGTVPKTPGGKRQALILRYAGGGPVTIDHPDPEVRARVHAVLGTLGGKHYV